MAGRELVVVKIGGVGGLSTRRVCLIFLSIRAILPCKYLEHSRRILQKGLYNVNIDA
jgi:hypothetical protein